MTTDFHQSEIEPGYPSPALEAWFMAVNSMMLAARDKGAVALSYQQAWNLTKRQHPDMYRAAFGDLNADPYCIGGLGRFQSARVHDTLECNARGIAAKASGGHFARGFFPKTFLGDDVHRAD